MRTQSRVPGVKGLRVGHRGTEKSGYLIEFSIGVQSFTLDAGGRRNMQETKWFKKQIKNALKNLIKLNQK